MSTEDLIELNALKAAVQEQLPGVTIDEDEPEKEGGSYWLDFTYGGNEVTVGWLPSTGFGIYAEDAGMGEGPEEVLAHYSECVIIVVARLKGEVVSGEE